MLIKYPPLVQPQCVGQHCCRGDLPPYQGSSAGGGGGVIVELLFKFLPLLEE